MEQSGAIANCARDAKERSVETRMSTAPIARTIERLAIICPSWVGDAVMATPLLRAVRAALPGARIIGAMRGGLDELLAGTPWLDETVVEQTKALLGPLRIARRLGAHQPQAALVLPNSFRSALIARLSGAARRIGYKRDGRGVLLTDALAPGRRTLPVSMVEYFAVLGEFALGLERIDRQMELAVTQAQREAGERLLQGVERPFVLINPGANKAKKRWPADRFAAVADALAKSHSLAAAATGSLGDRDVVAATVTAARCTVHNLVDRGISLGSLKAVIQEASLLITNDTGPRHIAAALGTPVVTLFGPTDWRWTAIDCPHERMVLGDPFLPEPLIADEHPRRCAIEKIMVGDVLAAAAALLAVAGAKDPPGPPAAAAPRPSAAS